ncbi:TetR/AcrR family transcriptional regulator [Rhodococcus sp. BP-349]|uniref:TetR/AcrR family transcriptional regulator n=1 Tax=unclassified Rhodococcus (in: high G+C Gram-positive bacteria) TaxID=192944 RepID=UPI001C9A37FC|nr:MULTISPECIES: TetR/AcrR family transcriptional regulator [unclassified Rhodococcus (in: high G+C Gram-positive bacteria)]MBY6540777.1 TetR/AcrR family transcriptional regulator [Rhodococcus sp. BP-363]MBY6545197.1 TetR/AcrR family transcriptional regulator [Rhodococcus sp. BP-369]MBY6564427.1 TetR/AcrR family transcriptional regulator [Rhodococcus sp. BP-370]MBY6578636.1 TetR/AcrR family transcriptional regulator [Rhodococcus sp. BP-364]MBY6587937.1 TetR/AcrR family transcriptional regulato
MAAGTRDRILDALESLLLGDGADKATLEAVASRAGVSKGGLLYHFPSKDAMVAALVRRLGERSDAQRIEAEAAGTSLAQFYLQPPDASSDEEIALYRSTLAALRSIDGRPGEVQQAVIEVMGMWDRALQREVTDPVQAEIVRLVGDGIYLAALLGLPHTPPDLHREVVDRLLGADTGSTGPA